MFDWKKNPQGDQYVAHSEKYDAWVTLRQGEWLWYMEAVNENNTKEIRIGSQTYYTFEQAQKDCERAYSIFASTRYSEF
jgi:hypothetical protein